MSEGNAVILSSTASAWNSLSAALQANPEKARAKYAPATATLESGLKCRVTGPSGEHIETDMTPAMGGAGANPNPGWFFRASLAACCSTVIAAQAARLGIDLTKLEVTVEGEGDNRGILGLDELDLGRPFRNPNQRADQRAKYHTRAAQRTGPVGSSAFSRRLHGS